MHYKFIFSIFLVLLLLMGCSSFSPTSGNNLNYNLIVTNINFGDKPNKSAYLFKKKLNELFSRQNNAKLETFFLSFTINKTITNYGTQQNSVNTRSILKFICDYSISDASNNIIDTGSATVADSFEISTSLYSAVITEEATENRLTITLANELRNIINSKIIKYTYQREQ